MTKGKNRIWLYVAVLTAALLLAITSMALAQVWTDQQDYTPGSVVTISGGNDANGAPGYYAGGTVDVAVTGPYDPAVAENGCLGVVVGEGGSWTCTVTLWADPAWAVGTYTYTATSTTAGGDPILEVGTFTDGNAAKVSGYVRDSATNPISDATVSCSSGCNGSYSTTTDNQGYYEFSRSKGNPLQWAGGQNSSATLTLTASKNEYSSDSETLTVTGGGTYTQDFTLTIVDNTPPIINCTVPIQSLWYDTNQAVNCTANDPSGLKHPTDGSFTLSTSVNSGEETATAQTSSYQVCDIYDNCATAGPYAFKIDMKTPQLSICDTPDGAWHAGNVTLKCHYTDGGSGPATLAVSLTTSVVAGNETANAVASAGGAQACDAVGNCADSPEDISGNKVDLKVPIISCTAPDQTIWYGHNVDVSCTASDDGSGLANTSDANFTLSTSVASGQETSSAVTDSKTVADAVGNSASSGTFTFKVDLKAPQMINCDAPDGLWHASDVTLYCYYTDGGSGLATNYIGLSTSVAADTETNNAIASANGAQACDEVGNCAASPADIAGNKIDKKAPQQTGCETPDGNWHSADVTLKCFYTDGGSGPATQDVSLSTNVAAGTETANAVASAGGAQACDGVGNCATSPADIAGNKIDKKAPQQTGCETPDGNWHSADVTLKCSYSDGGSGPATQDVSLSTNVAAGTETANAVASAGGAQACDGVGNCAASPVDIAGNKIDKKAPSISVTVPSATEYTLNQVVISSYSCEDSGSGVASCIGTVANGSNLDTASVGSKTFTVNAADNVGNAATTATVTYNVKYRTGGMCYGSPEHQILQPINADGMSVFKQKSTVPAKFRVCDASGISIGTPGVVSHFQLIAINGITPGTINEFLDSTTPDTAFRWSPSDQLWIFNISTKNQNPNYEYVYLITLNDGSTIQFSFKLK